MASLGKIKTKKQTTIEKTDLKITLQHFTLKRPSVSREQQILASKGYNCLELSDDFWFSIFNEILTLHNFVKKFFSKYDGGLVYKALLRSAIDQLQFPEPTQDLSIP